MKVLVQNCQTREWLREPEEWTANIKLAKTFPTSVEALRYCQEHRISKTQIVLRFGDERFDVKIPVSDECRS
jgi:hypothetical protein